TARVQAWITALKLILLVLFVIAGLAVGWPRYAHLADRPPMTGPLVVSMMFSLVYISYAYIGWNAASYLAGEVVDPRRNLPRAILIGTAGVVVLYLGLNVVYALALSVDDIRAIVDSPENKLEPKMGALAPIGQLAAKQLFGTGVSRAFSTTIGLMLLSSLSAYVLTGPRVIYAMAKAGQFPTFAGRLTRRAETPAIATALQVSCSLVLLWTGSFESLLVYASVGLAIFSMLAISAIYVLRWRRPDLPRPFRTPGYPVTPAVYLIVTSILTGAAFTQRPEVSGYSLISILAGIPVYYLWRLGRVGQATP
ncbi:APC family permease, partial [Singulisphaera rosea]